MGATIALFAVSKGASKVRRSSTVAGFVVLANVPDLAFPGWGHDRYEISHSVFSIALIGVTLSLFPLLSQRIRRWCGGSRVPVMGSLAMMSHLLLDSAYNHGKGLGAFWPFSDARLNLALPWFETLKTDLPALTMHSLRVMAIEAFFYGGLLLIALLFRKAWEARRVPNCASA